MTKIQIVREAGRLWLYLDAKELHDTLDALGCTHDGRRYLDGPLSTHAVCTRTALSTDVFLLRQYPAKFDLTTQFASPPSYTTLKELANSGASQVRRILEHYQPIDIRVEISKKVVAP